MFDPYDELRRLREMYKTASKEKRKQIEDRADMIKGWMARGSERKGLI
jgi:hypothetical protein